MWITSLVIFNCRFILRKEKEKRQKGDLLCEKYRVQLRKKEEHSIKEVEMNPPLETTIRAKDFTLAIIRDNEVSESSEKEKCRLDEKRMLWDEIAKLRLEMDSVKNQTLEMGKGYFEDIAIGREKKNHPQKTITETVSQHNAQLEVLRAELRMLKHKLEIEQQNRGRLEAQVESYRSRLATAVQDHEHCQASKRELQLAFQRARDESFCLWDKMNLDMSNLKHNNEILSQRLSEVESKNSSLEIELHHLRDALKERTLVLEGVERDLSQKQCQKEETEHVSLKEPGEVDKDTGKQESFMERLSHLQSEMMLLQQQLDQDHNQADREEKTVINTQDQIRDIIKIFDHKNQKYVLQLHGIMMDLLTKWHGFKETIHQYENDNAERNVSIQTHKYFSNFLRENSE
ncbi:ankyrin repeat domain-containing protein 26-like [Myotis daubentonii]|uniref:ankyrin repeat domain-containing protein 26-like n=1 Tax=Myotis daubentonii TaxID=98922 RepID=UPI002872D5F3|nr:ankyrin repeat domain-containing protein 26-like [Myotis daubentonii]